MLLLQGEATRTLPEKFHEVGMKFFEAGSFAAGCITIFLLSIATLGVLYLITVIVPGITQRTTAALKERNVASFALGIPVLLFFLVSLSVLKKAPPLAVPVAAAGATLLLLGWCSVAEDLGRRLFAVSNREGSRACHLAAGWFVFVFASLFPVLGWFVAFPYLSLCGLGSLPVGLWNRRPATTP